MIAWSIETLIASTLLMLLVLAIRAPVRRHFGPNMAYALWALPALRMLLPPLPEGWNDAAHAPIAQASEAIVHYVTEPIGGTTPAEIAAASPPGAGGWPWVMLGLWAVGAIGFILYHLIRHSRFCARARRLACSSARVAAGNVAVIETDAATGPLAFGIWRKYVAFPRDFAERYDPLERDLALAHELGHHARGDLLANWAALVVLALHWFNPVAWRAFRAFRADQEMACDALVLSGRAAGLRQAYGRAIVKSAHGGAVSAACHLHTINELKGRLRMLTVHERKSRGRLIAGTSAVAALTLAGLGFTASGTQAAERVRANVEAATGVDLASIELPAVQAVPPAPPAPPEPPVGATPPAPPAEADKRKHRVIVIRDKDGKVTTREIERDGDWPADAKVFKHRFAFRTKDGKPMAWQGEWKDMPELREKLKNLPEISSRDCKDGEGDGKANVIRTEDGKKRIMIICTNRIERMAADAHRRAAEAHARSVDVIAVRRDAMASALDGLRNARSSIERSRSMTEEQRNQALAGIDQAIREMESERKD